MLDRLQAESAGWRRERGEKALAEVHGSIAVPKKSGIWRFFAFMGPGYLVATGYMDPGNWATSLAGGSKFGYGLLTVALLSNMIAILLQALCSRLGVASGRTSPRPAATPSRGRSASCCGCWPRPRSAPPTSPR